MATLYIVGTPIGNLKDISLRALETLKEVDLILCEDTRVTKTLLDRYQIKTRMMSYHQHSEIKKVEYVIQLIEEGKNLALVSDAGTPGISDPGNKLIAALIEAKPQSTKVLPIPGPSALTAAASVAGFPMGRFLFLGFPPVKKKRKKFFEEVINAKYPVVFYESPHRILKSLEELKLQTENPASSAGGYKPNTKIVVCRELTKKFETVYRGTADAILKKLESEETRGEFVVIVGAK